MGKRRASKVVVFALGLAPVLWLGWRAYNGRLTANPIEFITHYTGDWTLRLVIITLFITPLRKNFEIPGLIRYRRMIGLFAFFYATLHFLTYLVVDKFFDWNEILTDIGKRTYITVGFTAFVILTALAVTSTAGSIRRLGGKRWAQLHRLIYVAVAAGVVHYYWSVKSDVRDPIFYGILAALLLGYRFRAALNQRRKRFATPALSKSPEPVAR
jgi:methionine sulfoxide reductase heme-binding subunit